MMLVTLPKWPPCTYVFKNFNIFPATSGQISMKLGMKHWGIKHTTDDGLTLTSLGQGQFCTLGFYIWEMLTMIDSFEIIPASDF